MSIVLLGSTSGSITLQEPAIAGTTTLNLPATSGTLGLSGAVITSLQMPAGSVIQVIQTAKTDTTSISVSLNTYNEFDSSFRVSITPRASSSRILLTASVSGAQNTGSVRYKFQFSTDGGSSFNDVTPIGNANGSRSRGHFVYVVVGDLNQANTCTMELLHSPSTTSPIIYRIQFGQDATTTYYFNRSINYPDNFLGGTYTSTFVAKEIAG